MRFSGSKQLHKNRHGHGFPNQVRKLSYSQEWLPYIRGGLNSLNNINGWFKIGFCTTNWKYHTKCRKQWAKQINNPSYEKLSKAIWEQEIEKHDKEEYIL